MKKRMALVLFAVVVAAGMMSPATVFAESENSVNLGFGGLPELMPHCRANVYVVEYERMLGPKIAFLGRGGEVDYTFDNGNYVEEGRPKGIDIGVRYYPAGSMKGLFFSGTLGYWKWDWRFTDDKGTAIQTQGKGDSTAIRADLDIGGRFPIGSSSISLMPALHIGRFFTSNTCEYTDPASQIGTSCSKDTEIKYYTFLSLAIGIGF